MELPKELVIEPLPRKFASNVDTRIRPDYPEESLEHYSPNNHPVTRRRYFVYTNDRMRDPSYNLSEDKIVRNPERSSEVLAEEAVDELLDKPLTEILEDPVREFVDNKVGIVIIITNHV